MGKKTQLGAAAGSNVAGDGRSRLSRIRNNPRGTVMEQPAILTPNTVLRAPSASAYTGMAVQTLARLRHSGCGPKFIKLGLGKRSIGYRIGDLDDWLDQRVRSSTSDPGRPAA